MFQQALDTVGPGPICAKRSARVHFGSNWVNESILEIHKEDISSLEFLLCSRCIPKIRKALIHQGKVPRLRALQIAQLHRLSMEWTLVTVSVKMANHILESENQVLFCQWTVRSMNFANAAFWLEP